MNLLKLTGRNLMRHPIRTLLTIGASTVAIFLMVFLRSVVTTLDDAVRQSTGNRLVTQSAVSLFVDLPENYRSKIEAVDGIDLDLGVVRMQWFGGYFKERENFFAQFAVDADRLFKLYPECRLVEGRPEDFFNEKTACVIGEALAKKYGWGIGDTIPLTGTIFVKKGLASWDFTVRGIYRSTSASLDENTLFFHYPVLQETLERGEAEGPDGVGIFYARKRDDVQLSDLVTRIDRVFAGGPQRTLTQPEAAFQAAFVSMFGNLPDFLAWIGAAVLFALLLTLFNTMLIAAGERLRDIGVLKALGFRDSSCARLFMVESCFLSLTGGCIGLALAWFSAPGFRKAFGTSIPTYAVRPETLAAAALVAAVAGIVGGIVPAIRARRLSASEALRAEI